jgi:hypothetical protein
MCGFSNGHEGGCCCGSQFSWKEDNMWLLYAKAMMLMGTPMGMLTMYRRPHRRKARRENPASNLMDQWLEVLNLKLMS